ncbi:MAG: hypothetical protein K6E94_00615 [Elusimicrobiaceae bacterium]|nr:hypothetical protein [Elusimicrobiaceae bacterium]
MRQNNVIHVELNEPYQGKKNWYFGSIAAIFEEIPKEVIGAGKEWLWHCQSEKDEHRTRKAIIRRSKVITKPQRRC